MQRRGFLQLAMSAAAGAAVPQAFAAVEMAKESFLHLDRPSVTNGTLVWLTGEPIQSTPASRPRLIELIWERKFGSADEQCQWVINGKPLNESKALSLLPANVYSLRMMNATSERHSVHLRHGSQWKHVEMERYSAVDKVIVVI